jgi:hypothetical protein
MRRSGVAQPRRILTTAAGLALLGAALTGCAVNAGSGAVQQFKTYMAGTPGVLAAAGGAHNDLPFAGSAQPEVLLDPTAAPATLEAAVHKALSFRTAAGTGADLKALYLQLGGDLQGDAGLVGTSTPTTVGVEVPWGKPADATLQAMIAVAAMPDVAAYRDDPIREAVSRPNPNAQLVARDARTACSTLAAVGAAFGRAPGSITVRAQPIGSAPTPAPDAAPSPTSGVGAPADGALTCG